METEKEAKTEKPPKLLRRDGVYYIEYENDRIRIEAWEAQAILADHSLVYDVIVSYRRKFQFNTSQDSIDFI